MMRIAVIEDDPDLAFTIRLNLERGGYEAEVFDRGHEGLSAVQTGRFDFVLLDLNLPDLDGFTVCRELRREPRTRSIPVVMLTARGSERDRVTGLELGADDYITKPFSVRELMARIATVARRAAPAAAGAGSYDDGELRIEENSFRVFLAGREVKLARKEFELLWLLVRHRSSAVSRERILSEIWRLSEEVETRTVDAHIRNLRRKIGADRISTVIGYGYRFDPPQHGT